VGCTANAAAATITNMARRIETVRKRVISYLLDHIVGDGEQTGRNSEAERPSGLEVDEQLEFRGLLNRQIRGLSSPQYLINVDRGAAPHIYLVWAVADQPSGFDS